MLPLRSAPGRGRCSAGFRKSLPGAAGSWRDGKECGRWGEWGGPSGQTGPCAIKQRRVRQGRVTFILLSVVFSV